MNWEELNDISTAPNRSKAESLLKQMGDLANKRLNRLSQLNLPSPAFSNRSILDEYGFAKRDSNGNFLYETFQSTGLSDLKDIRHELKHIQSFLASKTSTVKGAKNYTDKIIKRVEKLENLGQAKDIKWDYESSKIFWRTYKDLDEAKTTVLNSYIGSKEAQQTLRYLQKNNLPFEDVYTESGRVLEDIIDVRNNMYNFADFSTDWEDLDDATKNMFESEGRYKELQLAEHIYVNVLDRKLKIDESY